MCYRIMKVKEMTEERKQVLTQLLNEALANLEIRHRSANRHQLPPIINVNEYKTILHQYWISHSINYLSPVTRYEPYIVNVSTKSKLLDFIREEFAPFIHEDQIQSASFFIYGGGPDPGYPLDYLLKQLMKIAIAFEVEKAISDVDRCTGNTSGSFQYIALFEGIGVEEEIQVFEGMRIVRLSNSPSEFPHYLLSDLSTLGMSVDFREGTLLVINASVSPIFCKPFPEIFQEEFHIDHLPFRVEVTGGKFSNFKVHDFYEKFCQALSLVCNSAVRIRFQWRFLEEYELFNLNTIPVGGTSWRTDVDRFGSSAAAGKTQIDEAKCLYQNLVKLDSSVREKLQIPIDRWIKSKTSQTEVDKMIDLGIALEALYLSESDYNREIRHRFSLHAAWHLGEKKEQRKALMKDFKAIYDWRSTVVHSGKLPEKGRGKKKKPYPPEEVEKFITNAQDLCRDSILKILENGKFPDWNDLILGEKSCTTDC